MDLKAAMSNKDRLFRATVESVLLYGIETWTVTKKLEKSVNECYSRMLGTALNEHWQQHMNNQELYGSLARVTETIRARRLRDCFKSATLGTPTWSPKLR